MANRTTIQVIYAPLPDDDTTENGALEYAKRATDFLMEAASSTSTSTPSSSHYGGSLKVLQPLQLKDCWIANTKDQIQSKHDDGDCHSITLFLVSCGPDGSVHRSVRQTTKSFRSTDEKNDIQDDDDDDDDKHPDMDYAVALLGHAVCKTSAEQAGDETFAAGRRLARTILRPKRRLLMLPVLETQIELVDPTVEFDPWLECCWKHITDGSLRRKGG